MTQTFFQGEIGTDIGHWAQARLCSHSAKAQSSAAIRQRAPALPKHSSGGFVETDHYAHLEGCRHTHAHTLHTDVHCIPHVHLHIRVARF